MISTVKCTCLDLTSRLNLSRITFKRWSQDARLSEADCLSVSLPRHVRFADEKNTASESPKSHDSINPHEIIAPTAAPIRLKKGFGSNSDSHGDAAVAATVENKAGDVILMMTVANSKIPVTPYFRKACSLLGVTTPGRLKQLFAIVRHKPLAHKESKLAEASP